MDSERTLIIVKPDGVQRGLTGEILSRFERRGLKIAAVKFIQISPELAKEHYAAHEGKPFFEGLVSYITSSPVLVAVLEGKKAIETVRNTMGATNPVSAAPGTIRGDLAVEIGRNLIHGSDGPESAAAEIQLYFEESDILSWERSSEKWIRE